VKVETVYRIYNCVNASAQRRYPTDGGTDRTMSIDDSKIPRPNQATQLHDCAHVCKEIKGAVDVYAMHLEPIGGEAVKVLTS
jgi:hypothetical protein